MEMAQDNNSCKQNPGNLVETYVAQCGTCGKWRSIKSQKQYEKIRSHALEKSFKCKNSCEEPGDFDVEGDSTRVWLKDRLHGSPKTPQGFQRILVLRKSCARTDVYYRTPQGKRLRSLNVLAEFLKNNEGFADIPIERFSFSVPKVMKKKTKFKDVAAPTNSPALVLKACETLSKKEPNKKRSTSRSKSSPAIYSGNKEERKLMSESVQIEREATDKEIESSNNVLHSQNAEATPSMRKRKRDRRDDKNTEKETGTNKPVESVISSPDKVSIEVLEEAKVDGKVATNGRKVSILYTGKLKDTGKLFESNLGEAPLRFRLGGEKVMKGLSIGIEGMRVGDKRRITIPPSLGYSEKESKEGVPKNMWLVYEVEAVKVR